MVGESTKEMLVAARLEAANRLAAWFAHHINNPLGAISGNAQLLARRLQRDVSDPNLLQDYMRYLDGIQSQTERCAGITAEMLNLTRPGDPELRALHVADVIREAIELIQYAHPDCRIVFDPDDKDALPKVMADKEWLSRVIFELLSNAVQALPGEPVNIEAKVVEARKGSGEHVRVDIRDCGPGIPEDVLPRIFDPFFSTRAKARGLGLTIGLEMMRKMGGSLRVARSERRGTIFTISIPVWGAKK